MDLNAIRSRTEAANEGQWIDGSDVLDGVRLKLRSLQAPDIQKLIAVKERETLRVKRRRDGALTREESTRIFSEVIGEAVILDWEGITDGGKPLTFSRKQAIAFMTDPAFWQVAAAIADAASAVTLGYEQQAEDIEGN